MISYTGDRIVLSESERDAMKKKKKGFLLAFPAISGFLFFYLIPFLIVLWYSVSFGIGKREFVGLDNYKRTI